MRNRPTLSFLALALCSASLTAIGCSDDTTCTLIGCGGSTFGFTRETWQPGDYELEVSYSLTNQVTVQCAFSIGPDDDNDAGAAFYEATCTPATGMTGAIRVEVHNGEPSLLVADSPASLQLTLRSADETLFDDTIEPDLRTTYPNGPNCGACRSASQTIEIP